MKSGDHFRKESSSKNLMRQRNLLKKVCFVLFAACFIIYGCELEKKKFFTVTFNSNGGTEIPVQTVIDGDKVTMPDPPELRRYTFASWYKEAELISEWDFDTDTVIADITLHAKWNSNSTRNEFTVTFNSSGGSEISPITVQSGGKITKPENPIRNGYTFDAWYRNVSLTNVWNFDTNVVTANITLYAKWISIDITNEFTVTFNSNGGSEISPKIVKSGEKITKPEDPKRSGYSFDAWYKNSALTNIWNFNTDVVTANMMLYAKWIKIDDKLTLILKNVVDDMFATSNEGTAHGTNSEWAGRPSFGLHTDKPYGYDNWTEVLTWGQVYASNHNKECKPRPGDPSNIKNCLHHELCSPDKNFPNVRVHIKDLELYIYKKDNTWERLDYTDLVDKSHPGQYGHSYVEDYSGDVNRPADIRFEPEGGISVQAGSGWNFHFWGKGIKLDSEKLGVKGIFVVCKTRLVGVVGNQDPKYLLNVGADHWRSDGYKDWGGVSNISVALGRFKYVTTEWQYVTMHGFTTKAAAQAAIIDNPSFSKVLLNGGIICE